jgi:ketosteroid isomerase-like protein
MPEHPNATLVRSAYDAIGRGDVASFADFLAEDIVWYESTPGFEGAYHGRDEALGLLARVFEETGIEMAVISVQHVLADDDWAVIMHRSALSLGDRTHTADYVDVYRVRDGRLTEHRHLAVDPRAEAAFFAG